ncbi:MAG: TnsA endonuclease N-terminal domain-containing protein [Anaerolineales bacterium]
MPVRIICSSRRSCVGSHPSDKLGRMVRYESTIERDLIYLFEFDPKLIKYEEQPLTIEQITHDGKRQKYTPDFLAVYTDKRWIYECKPEKHVNDEITKRQVEIGTQWASDNNCNFKLVTDKELRSGPRLENIKILWRYGNIKLREEEIRFVRDILKKSNRMTISALCELEWKATQRLELPRILAMVYQKRINIDLDIQINNCSCVWIDK